MYFLDVRGEGQAETAENSALKKQAKQSPGGVFTVADTDTTAVIIDNTAQRKMQLTCSAVVLLASLPGLCRTTIVYNLDNLHKLAHAKWKVEGGFFGAPQPPQ